jgi:hypothetical protein
MTGFENPSYESGAVAFSIDETAKGYLLETARWAKFLAIVGFVVIGLLSVGGLILSTAFSRLGNSAGSGYLSVFMFVVYVLIAILYFFPTYYLFRFSSGIKPAVLNADQGQLNESLLYLRKAFRFIGVLTLVGLGIYALALIVVFGVAAFI